MKTLHLLLAGAVSLLAIVSCNEEAVEPESEPEPEQGTEYDETWYADNATVSSTDAHFADTEEGWEISFKAEGGSVVVYVDCGTEWTAENSAADIFGCDVQSASITVTADKNLVEEELHGTITLMTAESQIHFATISITQDARAYITLSAEEFEFDKKGGEVEVTVESNYEWSYAYESDWFTVSENTDGSLTITVDVNTNEDAREDVVTFTAGDGAANVAEATLIITQSIYSADALVLEYTIHEIAIEIELPIADVSYAEIDWGDGETETTSSDNPSHIYTYAGTYTVSISGTVKSLTTRNISSVEFLTAVIQWGDLGLTSMLCAFYNCSNLTSLPDGPGPFENVMTFDQAFEKCTSLKEVPEDLFKNCTEAFAFGDVFAYCSSLVAAPSFEGLSNVDNFEGVFMECLSLTTVPENIFSGCTEAMAFGRAFLSCSSLKTIPTGIFSDCTKVTYFELVFQDCEAVEGESPYTEINVDGTPVKVHLYERENYPDYFTAPRLYTDCFIHSTFSDMDSIPSSWGGNAN